MHVRRLQRLKQLGQKGDTIIEVLICLAVLGFILAVSYSIAARAQQTIRSSQERSEALKLAEGQLEQLKSSQRNNADQFRTISAFDQSFCFDETGAPIAFLGAGLVPPNPTNPNDLNDDKFVYPNQCKGLPHSATNQPTGLYNIAILGPDNASGAAANQVGGGFTVRVRWNHLGSPTNDEVKLEYKLYGDN